MFERYTEKARRVIFFARYEASQFGSPYIESEHLLLGLLRESKALSARLFAGSTGAIDKIRKQIEGHTTFREKILVSVDLPISDEGKRILLYAREEADALAHQYIGTEHLLLGMLREQNCYAAHLLNENGVAFENARAQISGGPREEVASPPRSAYRRVVLAEGAMGAAVAEHAAELHLQSQGIRVRSVEYACGAGREPEEMTVCVPKEMPSAEIEQKINAENVTGIGPWWKVSSDKTFRSGEPHPCSCHDNPSRLHYVLLRAEDVSS